MIQKVFRLVFHVIFITASKTPLRIKVRLSTHIMYKVFCIYIQLITTVCLSVYCKAPASLLENAYE